MASTPKAFAGQDFNFDPLGLAVKCATRRSELVGPGDFWGSFFGVLPSGKQTENYIWKITIL